MKTLFGRGLFMALTFFSAGLLRANDYKSDVIQGGGTPVSITVQDNRFLVIRTFTQQGDNALRGLITVTVLNGMTLPTPQNVLSASFVPTDSSTLETVNSVVISGPAAVSVTCPDVSATCFVTYRKESEP